MTVRANNSSIPRESTLQYNKLDSWADIQYKRAITTERIYFGRPINYVLLMARISGPSIGKKLLRNAINALIPKFPLIISRFFLEQDGSVWLVPQNNPLIQIKTIEINQENEWLSYASKEHMTYFDPFTGPLIRFCLLLHGDFTDLVITCHHAICDGISLKFLIHDLIAQLADPSIFHNFHNIPPVIDESMIPVQPGNKLEQFLMKVLNKVWRRQNIIFEPDDYRGLHGKYWSRYTDVGILKKELSEEIVTELRKKCKDNRVTIHSFLLTALLAAQYKMQYRSNDKKKKYLKYTHMPVNMRGKYLKPIGDDLGFYAASIILEGLYNEAKDIWENAKQFHRLISRKLSNSNLFQLLRVNSLSPTLLDATYFQKLGVIDNKISRFLNKKMGITNTMVGTALTNLGIDQNGINYPPYQIEAIYGPSVFSELLEKIVSAITLNNRMYMTFTFEKSTISTDLMHKFLLCFTEILENSLKIVDR